MSTKSAWDTVLSQKNRQEPGDRRTRQDTGTKTYIGRESRKKRYQLALLCGRSQHNTVARLCSNNKKEKERDTTRGNGRVLSNKEGGAIEKRKEYKET